MRRSDLQIARVERGSVDATIQATGTVVPEVETVISSPVEARALRIQHRAGDQLHAGDAILTLDTSATKLDLDKLNDAVAQKESALAQARLKAEEEIAACRRGAGAEAARLRHPQAQGRAEHAHACRGVGVGAGRARRGDGEEEERHRNRAASRRDGRARNGRRTRRSRRRSSSCGRRRRSAISRSASSIWPWRAAIRTAC